MKVRQDFLEILYLAHGETNKDRKDGIHLNGEFTKYLCYDIWYPPAPIVRI